MIELRLSEAAKFIGGAFEGIDKAFRGVSTDTRKIRENELFIALKGLNFNGNDFVNEAFTKGAAGCIVSYEKKKDKQKKAAISSKGKAKKEKKAALSRSSTFAAR